MQNHRNRKEQCYKGYFSEQDDKDKKNENNIKWPKVKSKICRQNKKLIRCGRPSCKPKYKEQKQVKVNENKDIQNISQSPILVKIMELILKNAQYKPITKVGSKKHYDNEKDKEMYQEKDKEMQMQIKKLNMQLKEYINNQKKGQIDDIFFLRTEKRIFEFENDNIKDMTEYKKLEFKKYNSTEVSQFINLINLIIKELSEDLIEIFKIIIEHFLRYKLDCKKEFQQIKNEILKEIHQNSNNDMDYLLYWNELKKISQNFYIESDKLKSQQEEIKPEILSNHDQEKQNTQQLNTTTPQEPVDQFISYLLEYFELLYQQQLENKQDNDIQVSQSLIWDVNQYFFDEPSQVLEIEMRQNQQNQELQMSGHSMLLNIRQENQNFQEDQQIKQLNQFFRYLDNELIVIFEKIVGFYKKQKEQNNGADQISGNLEKFINEDSQIELQDYMRCLKQLELIDPTSTKNMFSNLVFFLEKLFNQKQMEIEVEMV